jgi:hypothetical protein
LYFFGFLWPNRDFSTGYNESKQKNPPSAQLASEVVHKRWSWTHSHRLSRPNDPSIVNWFPQKDISYISGFVNELDFGPEVGDRIQNEPRGSRSQISSRPWRR